MNKKFYVFIMTNRSHSVLYTSLTNNIRQTVSQHKEGKGGYFTRKYRVRKLVYVAEFSSIEDAKAYEKKIKGGSRQKKKDLINQMNPYWKDLYREYITHG